MDRRHVLLTVLAVVIIAVSAVSLVPELWTGMLSAVESDGQSESDSFTDEFVHKHASLFFLVDGERKNMSAAYMERDRHIHFHHDDGVIHIEGPDANVSAAMDTLNIAVNETCVRYGLDNETYCEQAGYELRFILNAENVSRETWLNHTIQQGDNIILFYGSNETTVPEEFFESLPEGYSPGYNDL